MSITDSDDADRLEQYIRQQSGNLPSCESMITLANWLYANEYFETNTRVIPTSDLEEVLEDRLEHQVGTVLDNLEEIDVVTEVSRGGGQFVLHERTGQAFFDPNNQDMIPLLEVEISRFLEDLHKQDEETQDSDVADEAVADGGETGDESNDTAEEGVDEDDGEDVPKTLREVARATVDSEAPIEDALTSPTDHIERIVRFDAAVTAVMESDEVTRDRDYEPMGWRNAANKWVLTRRAKGLKENKSLLE